MKQSTKQTVDRLMQEIKRGNLTIAVMCRLQEQHYGYSLQQELESAGLEITQDTLYPLLRRLEQQQLLESRWITDGSRPRRYYCLSDTGREVFPKLLRQWEAMTETIRSIIT